MILFPPAKINLGLNVTEKRSDGYHNLETIMYQIPFNDVLEVVPAQEFAFTQTGLPIAGTPDENLCARAYRLLRDRLGVSPVKIHLHKVIPMGAGMGGGSADATYVLKAINALYELGLGQAALREYALELGSDCPLFVDEQPQFAMGRGELLSPITVDLAGKHLLLVNLGIHVSTQVAFSRIHPRKALHAVAEGVREPIERWSELLVNDFEKGVFQVFPVLQEVKKHMYQLGANYASMTGSGSTIFGIFDHPVVWDAFPDAPLQKWIAL